jgi:excisionase family DNA binding protein
MIEEVTLDAPGLEAAQMLTYAEAAALLKVDKRTIRRRVAGGRYLAYGDGSGKRLLFTSIIADIQRRTTEGCDEQT